MKTVETFLARDYNTHAMMQHWVRREMPQFDANTIYRVDLHRLNGKAVKAVVHTYCIDEDGRRFAVARGSIVVARNEPVEVAVANGPTHDDHVEGTIDELESGGAW